MFRDKLHIAIHFLSQDDVLPRKVLTLFGCCNIATPGLYDFLPSFHNVSRLIEPFATAIRRDTLRGLNNLIKLDFYYSEPILLKRLGIDDGYDNWYSELKSQTGLYWLVLTLHLFLI